MPYTWEVWCHINEMDKELCCWMMGLLLLRTTAMIVWSDITFYIEKMRSFQYYLLRRIALKLLLGRGNAFSNFPSISRNSIQVEMDCLLIFRARRYTILSIRVGGLSRKLWSPIGMLYKRCLVIDWRVCWISDMNRLLSLLVNLIMALKY